MKIYVNINAQNGGDGSKDRPYNKIAQAAAVALPGDEVSVAPGIYREDVSPVYAGTEKKPIVYKSEVMGAAVITGADVFTGWEHFKGDVWKLAVSNERFGDYNPYTTLVWGDWLEGSVHAHTGELFCDDRSFYERDSLDKVLNPAYDDTSWDREFTLHTWYTCQDNDKNETLIYANFCGIDPNKATTELTVRPHCFWPKQMHVDYITLSGFKVCKAATQWAPPTALQEGMIGTHWSKGWIMEDLEVSHAKCSGISLGKYRQQNNDNKWSRYKYKDGAQTQRDCSFIAQLDGWSKETVGSHTIRRCNIHDCGQTGIVGNLGCVFSVIEDCHIHHINNKRDVTGAELGGIKFHAAIDVIIRNNHIHDCVRGIWLDWQTQGTRVTGNLFHDNCLAHDYLLRPENKLGLGLGEDIFIEIAHGPVLVDNNVMLSERSIKLPTQGAAFVHNLIGGAICAVGRGVKNGSSKYDSTRYTPIHRPHSTEITGVMSVLHGDVRFYNNVFVALPVRQGLMNICEEDHDNEWDDGNLICGTLPFSGYMTEEKWKSYFEGYCGEGDADGRDKYYMPLPVWTGGNVFFNGAKPCDIEADGTVDTEHIVSLKITGEGDDCHVETDYMKYLPKAKIIDSDTLGEAFEPKQRFEAPDGSDIVFDTDFYGKKRATETVAGPFA
ncbi:MAG: right-handed parallel beta-helix repeat-containing protein [Lachnospiraceae bacterium]|nr:right-handed parallel beta-helix repeat-containing protein [Lachnospiraceae bacterium]